ncbi:MAG: nitrogen regulation protein NR(I) [Desulfuromonadales bacterium]|nr:nitrogen regulation protein NR(I) [Desulfuromonadales bacterium]
MAIQRILVADDEESIRWVLSRSLGKQGYQVDLAENGDQAFNMLRAGRYDMALLDIKMPGRTGLDLLDKLQQISPNTLVVIMTAESSMKNAVEAMKRGAYDYLTKPFDLDALDAIIVKAGKASTMTDQVTRLKAELKERYQLERAIIGESAPMQTVYKTLGKIAPSDVTVLICGESGTGKELIARAVHFNSPRLGKPFVAINCAAIPGELLESELFGHEKGAFTGATERKAGKFEQANGGTLFLDEIGDMPLELQAKLLRVLQEREITRTGGSTTIRVDVRVVAATNQNLKEKVRAREFREDLFYRLNVVPIDLPPLRERREDLPALIDYFIGKAKQQYGTPARGISKEARQLLNSHDWPGNIRELENTIQRAALLSPDATLETDDFPELLNRPSADGQPASLEGLIAKKLQDSLAQIDLHEMNNLYDMVLHQMERPLINIVLQRTRGNQVKAAEVLGINRNTLRKKIQTLKIELKRNGE